VAGSKARQRIVLTSSDLLHDRVLRSSAMHLGVQLATR
jgi:hypothetical protein